MLWRCSTYTHERSMDVFIKITEIIEQTPQGVRIMAQWWNRGQGQGAYLIHPKPEVLFIPVEKYSGWSYYEPKEK